MLVSTLAARLYYFACIFLYDVLVLANYLDEEVAKESISHSTTKWRGPFDNLIDWALEERFFPMYHEKLASSEEDVLFSKEEALGDLLTFYFAKELNDIAIQTHQKYPSVSESIWLYYYYCGFLRQALTEFEQALQEPGSAPIYYERYRQGLSLFNEMAKALESERPFLDTKTDASKAIVQAVWSDIDNFVAKLGAEWRQAVHAAARDLELPDSFKNEA